MELVETENNFYAEIGELLKQSRNKAYKVVNTLMVQTYWQIGKRIVEQGYKEKAKLIMEITSSPIYRDI